MHSPSTFHLHEMNVQRVFAFNATPAQLDLPPIDEACGPVKLAGARCLTPKTADRFGGVTNAEVRPGSGCPGIGAHCGHA